MDMTGIEPLPELSLEEVQLLSDKDRSEYLALKRMFGTDGWKIFIDQFVVLQQRQQIANQLSAPNWDSVNKCRGAFAAFQVIRDLEQSTESVYRALAVQATELQESELEQ